MPLLRLLSVVALVSCCVGQLLAQSQQNDNSGTGSSQLSLLNTSSNNPAADWFQLDPNLRVWFGSENIEATDVADSNHVDWYTHPASHDSRQFRAHKLTAEIHAPFDATCYAIRSYIVVRESAHSDVTHRDGSTTCVPAARVRMYSTIDQRR